LNSTFRIDYEWVPSEYGNDEERATLAEIALFVGGHCATELEDGIAKTVRRFARLSALHLAEWFAANWWRLLWEPKGDGLSWRMSHKIGGAGGGYIWPDLSFSSDWQSVLVSSCRTEQSEAQPIRYLNDFSVSVPVGEFERGLDRFMSGTVARLADTAGADTELRVLWRDVINERRDHDLSRWRKLEACMGYDPDEAPKELLDNLQEATGTYGMGAVHEMAAACKKDTLAQIDTLAQGAQCRGLSARIDSYHSLRRRFEEEVSLSYTPWKRAKKAAGIARSVWNIKGAVPTSTLADLFTISESELSDRLDSPTRSLSAGFREDDPSAMRISWNIRSPAGRRFSLARLVADHLASHTEEKLLPATKVITSRQQFQRAFAQEFLCPYDPLQELIGTGTPDEDDIEYASEHFDVSTWVVVCTLVNNGVLPRDALADWGVRLPV
jgi:hypothetical protein